MNFISSRKLHVEKEDEIMSYTCKVLVEIEVKAFNLIVICALTENEICDARIL